MARGPERRRFLGSADIEVDALLTRALEDAHKLKVALRTAMRRAGARPKAVDAYARRESSRSGARAAPAAEKPMHVRNPSSVATFDAVRRLTTMIARAEVDRSPRELAPLIDPRSWGASDGVVAAALLVRDHGGGEYKPHRLEGVKLGEAWGPGLLYEYARSDIASFENILRIGQYTGGDDKLVRADYELYDCLLCTFGSFTAPGGLTANAGYFEASVLPDGWSRIEVKKCVKVRDLTPFDPGNRYDFGEMVNATIGAALSQWVNDISMLGAVA